MVVMIVLRAGQVVSQFSVHDGWKRRQVGDRPAGLAQAIARWRRESGRARPPNGLL